VYTSQAASEGKWYWASGPEKGQQFWQGGVAGSTVGGRYAGWRSSEPNNQGSEQYAYTYADGTWNDSYDASNGYIVEYGGLSSDPSMIAQTVTLAVDNRPVAGNDSGVATEAGGRANGAAGSNATGTVRSNDTDPDSAVLTVTAVRTGDTEGGGTEGTVGQALAGRYGTLTLNADGGYSYAVDDANSTVQALAPGQILADRFNYTVSDGSLSDTAVLTVTISGANDAPTIVASPTAAFTEGTATPVASDAVLADVDSATLSGLIVKLDAAPDGKAERLSVTGLPAGISTTGYDAVSDTLTLTGTASTADYQAALRLVRYNNRSDNPTIGDRTIKIKATDSGDITGAAVVTLTVTGVNDAPTATVSATQLDFNDAERDDNALVVFNRDLTGTAAFTSGTPVVITPSAVLSDVDNTTLSSLTITLAAAPDGLAEGLLVSGLPGGITTTGYNSVTRTLTLTGTASLVDYQAALRLVRYNNNSTSLTTANRSISITATDSGNATSLAATVTLTVSA
jgi:VCBS repeat-containing protein